MYVTVSTKDYPTIEAFAADEQQRFRSNAPDLKVTAETSIHTGGGQDALVFHLAGDPGRNHELVGYVDGPTKYYIVVISARSADLLKRYQPAFRFLLDSFVPMKARIDQ